MVLLGIDISLSNLGLALANFDMDSGVLTPYELRMVSTATSENKKQIRKNSDDLERARLITAGLREAESIADVAIVEMPTGSQSSRAMASYGISVGAIATLTIPLIQVLPTEIKKRVTGSNAASKGEVIAYASERYPDLNWLRNKKGILGKNEHMADAVVALETGIESEQFRSILTAVRWIRDNEAKSA